MSNGIPDYADERAHKFFERRIDGKGRNYYWCTDHQDLEPTRTLPDNSCAYCGHRAKPIQAGLRKRGSFVSQFDFTENDYQVTGYTCCCKGAMDEVAHKAKVVEMEDRHHEELADLKAQAPKPSVEAYQAFIVRCAKRLGERADDFLGSERLQKGLSNLYDLSR